MRRVFNLFSLCMLALIVLAACAPQATTAPAATQAPATEVATEAPATSAPTEAATTPTDVPVEFTPPPMEVGSELFYADGTYIVAVPGGAFTMGKKNGSDNPEHTVTLSDFWIYETEVTNEQYAACVAADQCSPPDLIDNPTYEDYLHFADPVRGVNYDQAQAYCTYVHGRLPTEAEWEKAARGPDGSIYSWGNDNPSCGLANYKDCEEGPLNVYSHPEAISYYKLLETVGNVYEWVADWYDPQYYRTGPTENPQGPSTGEKRVYRSSGYTSNQDQIPLYVRFSQDPISHSRDLGFRCVVDDPTYFAPYCQLALVYGLGPNGKPGIGFGGSTLQCPNANINVVPFCKGDPKVGYANVSAGPAGAQIDGPYNCQGSFPLWTCDKATTVSVDVTPLCVMKNANPPGCPLGYVEKNGMCFPGATHPGQCLPGFNYDPANQCCSAINTPGKGAPIISICPAGTVYNFQTKTCDPLKYPPAKQEDVIIPLCISGNPGGDLPCDPADPTCGPPSTEPPGPCPTCPGSHP